MSKKPRYRTKRNSSGKGQISAKHVGKAVRSLAEVHLQTPMLLRVSSRGNTIIPQAACKKLSLKPGDQFELVQEANGFFLVPASDRPKAYEKIHKRAVEVLEDEDHATLWLNRPQFGLGGAVPVEHMRTARGAQDVEDLLGRIEHVVF